MRLCICNKIGSKIFSGRLIYTRKFRNFLSDISRIEYCDQEKIQRL